MLPWAFAFFAAVGAAWTCIGFTTDGVAAGSFAAAFQAWIGNVSAGSFFAWSQSFGATGGFVKTILAGIAGFFAAFFAGL